MRYRKVRLITDEIPKGGAHYRWDTERRGSLQMRYRKARLITDEIPKGSAHYRWDTERCGSFQIRYRKAWLITDEIPKGVAHYRWDTERRGSFQMRYRKARLITDEIPKGTAHYRWQCSVHWTWRGSLVTTSTDTHQFEVKIGCLLKRITFWSGDAYAVHLWNENRLGKKLTTYSSI